MNVDSCLSKFKSVLKELHSGQRISYVHTMTDGVVFRETFIVVEIAFGPDSCILISETKIAALARRRLLYINVYINIFVCNVHLEIISCC